ncbi:chromatin accessibility complex 16kD protein-like [Lycorma delicatula]|uniref:chromatin accessibility complex 16kD protein-like n=1 Tax=Lycorma delicatula TaxID=130591 RepID=UPI003F516C57
MSGNKSPVKSRDTQLPMYRVRTIMKSSPDVENIGQDSLYLVTRATELFIQHLSQQAYEMSCPEDIEYKHLAEVVQTSDNLLFLREMLPRKITVKQYREIMERKRAEANKTAE